MELAANGLKNFRKFLEHSADSKNQKAQAAAMLGRVILNGEGVRIF
jgi:hypothetical protein